MSTNGMRPRGSMVWKCLVQRMWWRIQCNSTFKRVWNITIPWPGSQSRTSKQTHNNSYWACMISPRDTKDHASVGHLEEATEIGFHLSAAQCSSSTPTIKHIKRVCREVIGGKCRPCSTCRQFPTIKRINARPASVHSVINANERNATSWVNGMEMSCAIPTKRCGLENPMQSHIQRVGIITIRLTVPRNGKHKSESQHRRTPCRNNSS